MALVDILDAIRGEAEEEQRLLRRRGEEKIEATMNRAAATAAEREEKLAASRDDEAEDEARAIRNRAHLQVERAMRAAREEAFSSVLEAVHRRLDTVRADSGYDRIFTALLAECRSVLPDASVLVVDDADRELATFCAPEMTVRTGLTTRGGMVLETENGRRVVNTLETRLDRAGPLLRKEFAELAGFREG